VRGINPNNLSIELDLYVAAEAITDHRPRRENVFQAFRRGNNISTTEFDVDLERKVVAILVSSAVQLARSNNLCNNSILDISPLLDGSTKLS